MSTKKSTPASKAPAKSTSKPAAKAPTKATAPKEAASKLPSKDEMVDAATDINTILELNPAIDLELTRDELIEAVKGIADEIMPKDQLAISTWDVLKRLGVGPNQKAVQKAQEKVAAKEEQLPVPRTPKDGKLPKAPKTKGEKIAKGPGIIAAIREFAKANGKKGFNREMVLEHLSKKFPERDADAMKKTVAVQIPNRVNKECGLTLTKNDKGMFKF
jgi:hypothetical protein